MKKFQRLINVDRVYYKFRHLLKNEIFQLSDKCDMINIFFESVKVTAHVVPSTQRDDVEREENITDTICANC